MRLTGRARRESGEAKEQHYVHREWSEPQQVPWTLELDGIFGTKCLVPQSRRTVANAALPRRSEGFEQDFAAFASVSFGQATVKRVATAPTRAGSELPHLP
jgi:hypothetical protein